MQAVRTRGMFLEAGGEKLFLRGVSYGPFRPGSSGEPFPDKARLEHDLKQIRQLGANTLRVYHVPPPWLRELARTFDLRLLVGIPWAQHVRFLDSPRVRREVRCAVRRAAEEARGAPEVAGLLVGNEIRPQHVRWYGARRVSRFLRELADEVHEADPERLLSYASFPMTECLELGFLDFVSVNVYLHREQDLRRYLRRWQNLASPLPLVLAEFGADALREGALMQARILEQSVRVASELGLAGTVAFAFTDEWHTGGHDVEDWAFGTVTREREPRSAYYALRRVFCEEGPPAPVPSPRVSVVICAYNAERTMAECLESLRHLRYPDYEVIVVDDGSTDRTGEIARRFPEFYLISQENRGLSAARNEGLHAATGEIVAYTDADCAADPDWLTHLVRVLQSGSFAGVGGPNLPPAEDEWVAEIVARSPGGPTHVLLDDDEAEHVPGCNMAFWRERLLEIDGFEPVFRTAGDDVDVCWRLRDAGHRIGFAAAALVWHRRRHTVRAYLRQQRGYGEAEALLWFKHPHRFNALGYSRWDGRIYGGAGFGLIGPPVVYSGVFGTGLFQTVYREPGSLLGALPSTLEWNAAAGALVAIGGASALLGQPLPLLAAVGLCMLATSMGQAVARALLVEIDGLPELRSRALVAVLTYLGPLARALRRRARSAPELPAPCRSWAPLGHELVLCFWNETGIERSTCVQALMAVLRERRIPMLVDDGWQSSDLALLGGDSVRGDIRVLDQNHGGAKREIDVGLFLRRASPARMMSMLLGGSALLAVLTGALPLAALLAVPLVLIELRVGWRGAQLRRLFRETVARGFAALPLLPIEPEGAEALLTLLKEDEAMERVQDACERGV